jgi:cell division protein FtsZ
MPGLINVDFADVKTIMSNAGSALMGIGIGSGENRATMAARQAISSPLLEVSIDGAKGVLFNIIAGNDLSMSEVDEAAKLIAAAADADANIIFGATIDESMVGQVKITVIATGFDENRRRMRELHQPVSPQPVASTRPYVGPVGIVTDKIDETPKSDILPDNHGEYEDEFDIPAFLRQGK